MVVECTIQTPTADETAELFDASGLNWPHDLNVLGVMLSRAQYVATARIESRLIGMVRILTDGEFNAFIADLAVHPAFQLRRIGRSLVRVAVEHNLQVKIVVTPTPHSIGFWVKCGFVEVKAYQHGCSLGELSSGDLPNIPNHAIFEG